MAGTYTVTADTTRRTSPGGRSVHRRRLRGCSAHRLPRRLRGRRRAAADPLRVFGIGDSPGRRRRYWLWTAPPTTTILSGQLSLCRLQDLRSLHPRVHEGPAAQRDVHLAARSSMSSRAPIRAPPGGRSQPATRCSRWACAPPKAHTYVDKWNNHVGSTRSPPRCATTCRTSAQRLRPARGGRLAQPGPAGGLTAAATDQGSGVAQVSLLDERGPTLDTATAKAQSAIQPGASSFAPVLCTAPAALGDGSHRLTVSAIDAAGEQHRRLADRQGRRDRPGRAWRPRPGTTAERRPAHRLPGRRRPERPGLVRGSRSTDSR